MSAASVTLETMLHAGMLWAIQELPEVMAWMSILSTKIYIILVLYAFSIGIALGSRSKQHWTQNIPTYHRVSIKTNDL